MGSYEISNGLEKFLPDSLQMHCPYFDNRSLFLALQNAIPLPSAHASHVQQFCTVNKVVVYESAESLDTKDPKRRHGVQ